MSYILSGAGAGAGARAGAGAEIMMTGGAKKTGAEN